MPRLPLFSSASAVEEAFYSALAHADLGGVMALWSDEEEVVCIHPGGPRLVGWLQVRQSYEQLLAHGPLDVRIRDVQVFESVTLSVHSLIEEIPIEGPRGPERIEVLATNVYVKGSAGWQLLMHHAAPAHEGRRPAHDLPAGKLH